MSDFIYTFQKGFNYSQDGPGNRLVYHLSGCNMFCPWCSNPEGLKRTDYSQKHTINEIFNEILSCRTMFFDGGGVTFTGGEVSLQAEAVLTLFKMLKKENITTCIETNASLKDTEKANVYSVNFPKVENASMYQLYRVAKGETLDLNDTTKRLGIFKDYKYENNVSFNLLKNDAYDYYVQVVSDNYYPQDVAVKIDFNSVKENQAPVIGDFINLGESNTLGVNDTLTLKLPYAIDEENDVLTYTFKAGNNGVEGPFNLTIADVVYEEIEVKDENGQVVLDEDGNKVLTSIPKWVEETMKALETDMEDVLLMWLEDNDYLVNEELEELDKEIKEQKYNAYIDKNYNYICFGTTDKDECLNNKDNYMYIKLKNKIFYLNDYYI